MFNFAADFYYGQNIIKKRDEYGRGKKGDVQEGGE